jgi:ADP-ribose pyrophosphatase YjhB (NUDIX family)
MTMVSIVNPSTISATGNGPATPGGTAGMKAPPVCDSTLKETAMTTEELTKSTFSTEDCIPVPSIDTTAVVSDVIPISSSSSTCTRESDAGAFSDVETGKHEARGLETPIPLHRTVSDRMNSAVSLRKASRQGRATQRWITDSVTFEPIRLVTGCVPILRGGKILCVSANRKPEWILPKGGWEQDETMEESAVRECFEEAGVLGILGPKLGVVQYETRKSKKRRVEQEEMDRQKRSKAEPRAEDKRDDFKVTCKDQTSSNNASAAAVLSDEAMSRIREDAQGCAPKPCLETASCGSSYSSAPYSKVRMTLFPLYVANIADTWPESGRFRTAIDIDEAIAMLDKRPELKAALEEVRQRGLHLVTEPLPL